MASNYESNLDGVLRALTDAEERALEMIGLFVEGEAKLRSPVDTGNLRSSIDHKVNINEKSVTIGTNVEYAPYLEFGTRKQPAQPYFMPAVEQNENNIKTIMEQELGQL